MSDNFLYLTTPENRRIMKNSFKTSSDVFVSFNMAEVGTQTVDQENGLVKFEVVLAAQPKLMAGIFGGQPKAMKKITCSYHNKVRVAVDYSKELHGEDSSGDFSEGEAVDVILKEDQRQTQELINGDKMFSLSALLLFVTLFF